MQDIRDGYYRLLGQESPAHRRYLLEKFNPSRRLTGLIGPRGVGKTTLMLQWIREKGDPSRCMYASLDHIRFSSHRLFDFVRDMHEIDGRDLFFLDEAHKYAGWNQEIKNIYDSFPAVRVVFSGSSSLDLVKGHYDLSRRGVIQRLNGLSFREYLKFATGAAPPAIGFDELLEGAEGISRDFSKLPRLRGHFEEYLRIGYYPFYFEEPDAYYPRILNTIDKTVYEDIAHFYSLNTSRLPIFKKVLAYLASLPPGELSVNTLGRYLEIDHKTVSGYLEMMQETGLIHSLRLDASGKAVLRAPDKVLLENANLYHAIATESGYSPNLGSLRETFFVNALRGTGLAVQYNKLGDFRAKGRIFEVGGASKDRRQIRGQKNGILVKDGPLTASQNEIPLYLFGFLW